MFWKDSCRYSQIWKMGLAQMGILVGKDELGGKSHFCALWLYKQSDEV